MIPNPTKRKLWEGSIDVTTATLRVALLKETTEYNPDPDNHEFVSDVLDAGTTGEEYDDTNYARQDLLNVTTSVDTTDDEGVFDADDVVWSSLGSSTGGQTVEAVLVYEQIGGDDTTPGDDPIIRILDDSEEADLPVQTNGEDFTWQWNSEGVATIQ